MTDKELLISAVEGHISDIGSKFFNLGIAGQLATKVVVRNLTEKYGDIIDLFITKEGRLVGDDEIFNAACELLDSRPEKGFILWKIKITSDDVRTIQKTFKEGRLKS